MTKVSKTCIFNNANEELALEYVFVPKLDVGQILVRNEYVTLCKSDVNTFCGKRIEKTPTILGHEIVGRIEAFGDGDNHFDEIGEQLKIGDRITWAIFASNPKSELSIKGIPQKSDDLFKYGHEPITRQNDLHGGLSDYIILRQHTPILKIDEKVPLPVAALVNCSIATIAGAIRLAGDVQDKNVLISGAGMLGMVAIAMCDHMGAASVHTIDINEDRLSKVKDFGANQISIIDDSLKQSIVKLYGTPHPFDIVIETSGQPSAMELSLDLLNIGGVAVWVGATYPAPSTKINAEQLIRKIHTIKGLHNYNHEDFKTGVDFIEKNYQNYPFLSLIYDHYSLDQVNEAFQYSLQENSFRVGVKI